MVIFLYLIFNKGLLRWRGPPFLIEVLLHVWSDNPETLQKFAKSRRKRRWDNGFPTSDRRESGTGKLKLLTETDKVRKLEYMKHVYLFIPRPSPPNGGWPTTRQTHALTPLSPSTPSSYEA